MVATDYCSIIRQDVNILFSVLSCRHYLLIIMFKVQCLGFHQLARVKWQRTEKYRHDCCDKGELALMIKIKILGMAHTQNKRKCTGK